MAVQKALSNATIIIDDDVISIIPDTLKYNIGRGEKKVRSLSSGGNSIDLVISEDATTKLGKVMFSMPSTTETEDLVDAWDAKYASGEGCTIQISDAANTKSFRRMFLVNNPETDASSEGVIEIEFTGQPII